MCIWMPDSKRLISEAPISELDRRNMEAAAKRWMKKKHPSFDGDVYVENVRCFLEFPEEEREKYECTVNGEKTTALIFSRKHLSGLYLQCLIYRKEAMAAYGAVGRAVGSMAIGSTDWKTWMYCFSVCCLTRWSGRMGRCTGILVPCIC